MANKYNETLDTKKDGVLFYNDDMAAGLLAFYEKQNTLLVENEINMVVWGYNSRTQKLISAPDDKSKESAELYMKKIVDGELTIIGENALFDGVKVQPANNSSGNGISQMIEYHQYIKSCLFNEVGIDGKVIGKTKILQERKNFEKIVRGTEIKMWMDENNFTGNYIIIDDDNDMLPEQQPFFIKTSFWTGITEKNVEDSIKLLNKI